MRPTPEQIAADRVELSRIVAMGKGRLAVGLTPEITWRDLEIIDRVRLATEPPTDAELIPVCVHIANEALDYASDVDDEQNAQDVFDGDGDSLWSTIVLTVRDRIRGFFDQVKP